MFAVKREILRLPTSSKRHVDYIKMLYKNTDFYYGPSIRGANVCMSPVTYLFPKFSRKVSNQKLPDIWNRD